MKDRLPVSLLLLHCIVIKLEALLPLLEKGSLEMKTFQESLLQETYFEDIPLLEEHPLWISFVQLLLLSGLSSFGGPSVPVLNAFSFVEDEVSLTWSTGLTDKWTFGVWDERFIQFVRFYNTKVLGKAHVYQKTEVSLILALRTMIVSYRILMSASKAQLDVLLKNRLELLRIISGPIHRDLLFLIISSLPVSELNLFFISIASYFPPELRVKNNKGYFVNVVSYFESRSDDFQFLSDKLSIYLDLYSSSSLPIVKEITQLKTSKLLTDLLQTRATFDFVQAQLLSLKTQHVELRLALYQNLLACIDRLELS